MANRRGFGVLGFCCSEVHNNGPRRRQAHPNFACHLHPVCDLQVARSEQRQPCKMGTDTAHGGDRRRAVMSRWRAIAHVGTRGRQRDANFATGCEEGAAVELVQLPSKAALGQAGMLHRFTKPVTIWRPRPNAKSQGGTQDPMHAAATVQAEWAAEWKVDSPLQPEDKPWGTCSVEPMPPITAEQVCTAGRAFTAHTGVGVDLVHPKLFGGLTQPGLEASASLLNEIERKRCWPQHQQWLL